MDIIGTTITFLVIGIDGDLHGDLTILDMEMVMVMVMVMVMECGITGGGIHTTMDQIIMIRTTTETIIELPT